MTSQDGSTSPRWHDLHRMCRFPQRTRGGSSNAGSGKETRHNTKFPHGTVPLQRLQANGCSAGCGSLQIAPRRHGYLVMLQVAQHRLQPGLAKASPRAALSLAQPWIQSHRTPAIQTYQSDTDGAWLGDVRALGVFSEYIGTVHWNRLRWSVRRNTCTMEGKIPQNCHTFAVFESPPMRHWTTPISLWDSCAI